MNNTTIYTHVYYMYIPDLTCVLRIDTQAAIIISSKNCFSHIDLFKCKNSLSYINMLLYRLYEL